MKAPLGVAALVASTLLFSASEAGAAGNPNGFGDKSQLIVAADRLVPVFSYTYASRTQTINNVELTNSVSDASFSLLFGSRLGPSSLLLVPGNVHALPRVAFDYTIIPHLTLGAAVAFGFGLGGSIESETVNGAQRISQKNDAPTYTAIGFAPRVGYIVPILDWLAIWPRGGVGIYSVSVKTEDIRNNNVIETSSLTDTLVSLDLEGQLAIVPLEHFFFNVGPLVNVPLTGTRSAETTVGATTTEVSNDVSLFHLGVTAGLGGWFNL